MNARFCSVVEFLRSLTREKRGEESERFWSHLAPEGYAFTAFRFRSLARCEGTPKNNLSTGPIDFNPALSDSKRENEHGHNFVP